jgi:hypothetical protein
MCWRCLLRIREDPLLAQPILRQRHRSHVVTDPKGSILLECGKCSKGAYPRLVKDGKPMKDKHGKVIYEPVPNQGPKYYQLQEVHAL